MSLNLRQIEVFRAVMTAGSISAAARSLYVSQPAISRLISHMEHRLGLTLFDRRRGSLRPTPEAKRLYREVESVYQGVRRINDLADDLVRHGTGMLEVAATPSAGTALLPAVIARFREERPTVRINFQVLSISDIVELVGAQRVDVGIGVAPSAHPSVSCQDLARGRIVCVLPRDHPKAYLSRITPDDLRGIPLITYSEESPYGQLVSRFLADLAGDLNAVIQVRFVHTACSLAQAGAGVTLADEFALHRRHVPDVTVRPIDPPIDFALSVLTARQDPISANGQLFIDMLFRSVRDYPVGHYDMGNLPY